MLVSGVSLLTSSLFVVLLSLFSFLAPESLMTQSLLGGCPFRHALLKFVLLLSASLPQLSSSLENLTVLDPKPVYLLHIKGGVDAEEDDDFWSAATAAPVL